jgi:hypothetical protein
MPPPHGCCRCLNLLAFATAGPSFSRHHEYPQRSRTLGAEIGDIDDAVTEFGVVLADETATLGSRAHPTPPNSAVTTALELSDSIVAHSRWTDRSAPEFSVQFR